MDCRINYSALDAIDANRSCRFNALRDEILKKCGEPTVRSGDTWIYDKPGGVKYVVVFDAAGYLARIG